MTRRICALLTLALAKHELSRDVRLARSIGDVAHAIDLAEVRRVLSRMEWEVREGCL